MNKLLTLLLLTFLTFGLVTTPAEARRLGGGLNIGKQRSSPAMSEAPREVPRSAPTPAFEAPRSAAPSAFAPGAAQRPGFFNRWGGVIAGVGAGALLGSMFGGHLGGFGAGLGGLINLLLIVGVLYFAFRFLASRRSAGSRPMQFAGAQGPSFAGSPYGAPSFDGADARRATLAVPAAQAAVRPGLDVPPGFEIETFVRQAQSSFLRLQAANDDRDLADLRETTTPEVFAELAMQIRERGDVPQKTDVVSLDAQLLEVVVEGEQMIASLRYSGLIRENAGAPALPFDEVWHLRRSTRASNDPWLIAGIQQRA